MGGLFYSLYCFAALFGLSKLVEKDKLAFWVAGIIYAVADSIILVLPRFIAQVLSGMKPENFLWSIISNWPHILLVALIASVVFWFLNRYTDTIAAWMITFVVSFIVLAYVI